MDIPKVFISYSHDSSEHKEWVLILATKLIKRGIDVILDQWDLGPGGDLPLFMEKHLKDSDRVLVICTEKYVEKANAGIGGVAYEKMILTSDLMKKIDSDKIIPIIRQSGTFKLPTFLETKLYMNFSHDEDFEFNYDELIRTIHNSPLFEKPEIGNNPFNSSEDITPKKSNNALMELMTTVINDYESSMDYSSLTDISTNLGISRILLELLIDEAVNKGLIDYNRYNENLVKLTKKGKFYAVENNLNKK